MTTKQLRLAQEIEQKFKELQSTIGGDKYISAFVINDNFNIHSSSYEKNKFYYFNGEEVDDFDK